MKLRLALTVLLLGSLSMASCSVSDKEKEEPSAPQEFPTLQEFNDLIADRLWKIEECKWLDADGNILPEETTDGFDDGYAYYFLQGGGFIFFGGPDGTHCSMINDYKYNGETGELIYYPNRKIDKQIVSNSGDEIILKVRKDLYRGDGNTYLKGSWRYQRLVLVENPDWKWILTKYPPYNYNPDDYGMK